MRILLVEDDEKLAKILQKVLTQENYTVDICHDGVKGQEKAETVDYDAIVLDWNIPEKDGIEVCKELREKEVQIPIIMLTGRANPKDRVEGLDSGADDYLPKPFASAELLARLRALLRRPKASLATVLQIDDLELSPSKNEVRHKGELIDLMPKEFSLLEYLMRHNGEVVSRSDLLAHVWGIYSNNSSNRLEVYIRYLREKVDEPFDTNLIKTVRGKGYKVSGA